MPLSKCLLNMWTIDSLSSKIGPMSVYGESLNWMCSTWPWTWCVLANPKQCNCCPLSIDVELPPAFFGFGGITWWMVPKNIVHMTFNQLIFHKVTALFAPLPCFCSIGKTHYDDESWLPSCINLKWQLLFQDICGHLTCKHSVVTFVSPHTSFCWPV